MTRLGILGAVLAVLWLWPAPAGAAAEADEDGIWLDIFGCKIWVKDKRATIDTKWEGTCRLGKATAIGSFTRKYKDADARIVVETYTGRWIEGRQQGKGRYENTLGVLYDGAFRDGLPDGQGIYRWPDGTRYSGGWKAGLRVGRGHLPLGQWRQLPRRVDRRPAHRLGCLPGHQGRQLRRRVPGR